MNEKWEGGLSGFSAEELFVRGWGITYDDFTVLDVPFTDVDKEDVSLETHLGNEIYLKTPIVASPMDTVTNAEMAIAMALVGGIAAIHCNHKDPDGSISIDKQIEEIIATKRWENGFIEDPVTVSSDWTIAKVLEIGEENKVGPNNPIDTFPVTYGGRPHGRLVGLLRKQDYSRTRHKYVKVRERMIPLRKLKTAKWPITLEQANDFLWKHQLLFLPIVEGNRLKYLVTRSDLDKNEEYPLATKDENKRLRVLFAVETRPEIAYERLERGFAAGADGCIIDTSQGNTKYEVEMIRYIRKKYRDKFIMGGNISTKEAYRILVKEGIHSYRNGQGPGSICTTAGNIGISRAGATGVYECARENGNMFTVADGGLRKVGDINKTIMIGANIVMLGNMLAGTRESPGDVIVHPESGALVKVYRGMGSEDANFGGRIRDYSKLPQGVRGLVQDKGSVHEWVKLIRDGMITAFQGQNCKNIKEIHEKMRNGEIRFERRTAASLEESRPHDLYQGGR